METNSVGSVSSNNSSGFWGGLAAVLLRGLIREIPILGFLGLLASGGCDENPSQAGLEDGSFIEVNNANPSRPAPDAGVPVLPPSDADVTFDTDVTLDAEMAIDAETVGDTDVDAIGDADSPSSPCVERTVYDGCTYIVGCEDVHWDGLSGGADGISGGADGVVRDGQNLTLAPGRTEGTYTLSIDIIEPEADTHYGTISQQPPAQPTGALELHPFTRALTAGTWSEWQPLATDGLIQSPIGQELEVRYHFSTDPKHTIAPTLNGFQVGICDHFPVVE